MAWQPLSLHFKQTYDGGWRYLDRCGEFMLAATERMDFMSSDAKPTGARLEMPEKGIVATVDSAELTVTQELPEDRGETFAKTCGFLSILADIHFAPRRVVKNGFASKSVWPMSNVEDALTSTLKLGGTFHADLAKVIDMVPAYKKIDCNFSSGSLELHVAVQAVTFEKVSLNRYAAGFQASDLQKKRVDRLNKATERFNWNFSHVLMLDADLIELDPPKTSLDNHFKALTRYTHDLQTEFTP